LMVEQIHDHQVNMTPANVPLLVIDGWEHAYYLQYLNDKAKWIDAFWKVADWAEAARRFDQARRVPQTLDVGGAS
jgi:superoxide dismutase, Fe-Mn family